MNTLGLQMVLEPPCKQGLDEVCRLGRELGGKLEQGLELDGKLEQGLGKLEQGLELVYSRNLGLGLYQLRQQLRLQQWRRSLTI
jgi:hypothetical protein